MNRLTIVVFAMAVLGVATTQAETNGLRRTTGKQRREARARRIAAEGGMLAKPYAGKYIVIVNDQKRIADREFFRPAQSFTELFEFPVQVVEPKTDVSHAAVVITISDNTSAPSLLVAPEVPWAGINVGALAADSPSHEKLVVRLQKESWRAFMYACGAANSQMQPCVMRPVFGVRDLDAQAVSVPCPESLPRVMATAKALGIGETSKCTYKQACEEGWAPAPTNEVQRAIWEKVHAVPKSPMRIEFDPKKGR